MPVFDFKVKVTQKLAHFPIHNVTCAPTKFEFAMFNGLVGDAFARNLTDGRTQVPTKRFLLGVSMLEKVANTAKST